MKRMKKIIAVFLIVIISISLFSAGGIAVTEKVKLVILPGKVGVGWNMDEIYYLLSILEEQALELGRFQLFPRENLQQIIKERNLSEVGISEAIEIGKLGGSKYALLLTLTELSAAWSGKTNTYEAVSRYTIRLYNIENGELLASKTMSSVGSSKETNQKAITNALKSTASSIWLELRNIFKIEAYVKSIKGDKVILAGIDPKIAKKGYIFKIETDTGVCYVEVEEIDKIEGTVVTKFMYGSIPKVYDIATEYPTLPVNGGLGFSLFSGNIGVGLAGWTDITEEMPLRFYFNIGTFIGTILDYTPAYINFGIGFNILKLGRIGIAINGGLSAIGLFDLETFEPYSFIYGAFADAIVTYEFNPSFGLYGSVGYSTYLNPDGPTGLTIQLGFYF